MIRAGPDVFKQLVISAFCEPGVSVAGVALAQRRKRKPVDRAMREHASERSSRRKPGEGRSRCVGW